MSGHRWPIATTGGSGERVVSAEFLCIPQAAVSQGEERLQGNAKLLGKPFYLANQGDQMIRSHDRRGVIEIALVLIDLKRAGVQRFGDSASGRSLYRHPRTNETIGTDIGVRE